MDYRGGREYTRAFKAGVAAIAVMIVIIVILTWFLGTSPDRGTVFTLMSVLLFLVVLTGAFALILFGNTKYYTDEGP